MRAWAATSLEAVVGKLDGYGYDCFFLQKHRAAVRITGCWHALFEFRRWANVLCVARAEAGMLTVLDAMTPMVSGQARSPDAAAEPLLRAPGGGAGGEAEPARKQPAVKKKRKSAAAGA